MKRFFQLAAALALGLAAPACDQGGSAEQNQSRAHMVATLPPPKCSLRNPLLCKSSGELLATPDFIADLERFGGKYELYSFQYTPVDAQFFGGASESKLRRIGDGLIFSDSCPEHNCGENVAVILRPGKILAVGRQNSMPSYPEENSDLNIFVEHLTPESEKWVAIVRRWGTNGQKVHVHETATLKVTDFPPSKKHYPKCSLQKPEFCKPVAYLLEQPEFYRELSRFTRSRRGTFTLWNAPLLDQFRRAFTGPSFDPDQFDDGLVRIIGCSWRCAEDGQIILRQGQIVAASLLYKVRSGDTSEYILQVFVERLTPESKKWIDILRSRAGDATVHFNELGPSQRN